MATFLDTTGISYHLEQIIKKSDERLILISPYLKLNDRIKELLDDKDRLKIDIRVIYGKNELQPDEINWLKSKNSIRSSFCKNLHAKCYLNEKEALITSMNLYEFSQQNNNEMGIYLAKETDTELYNEIYKEVQRLLRISEEVRVTVEKIFPTRKQEKVYNESDSYSKQTQHTKELPDIGFCIRCKEEIDSDPSRPYCRSCFDIWRVYENNEFEEKFCHLCGSNHKSTMAKPLCRNCYKAYKHLFVEM